MDLNFSELPAMASLTFLSGPVFYEGDILNCTNNREDVMIITLFSF